MVTNTESSRERTVLVTGASSGIGRATAVAFGGKGVRVAVTYHSDREGAEETAERVREAGGDAFVVRYDMTDRDSVETAVQAVLDHWGSIDVLVNNAVPSIVGPMSFEDLSSAEWRRMVHGIQDGVFHTVQAVLPALRSSEAGRIVTVSSSAADGSAGMAPYATAKAGLHGLIKVLASDLGEMGILSNVVTPGMVLTEKNLNLPEEVRQGVAERTPSKRVSTPEDVAELVVFLASSANGNVNGAVVPVTGGS